MASYPDPFTGIEGILTEDGVERWLDTPIPALDWATPSEALADGQTDAIRQLVASYRESSFS